LSGLILLCARCRREAPHAEVRDGLCATCRVDDATREARSEVARLKDKLKRYQAKGTPVESLERQLLRARQRLVARARAIVSDERRLEALLKDMI
jgi:hypothetical protein